MSLFDRVKKSFKSFITKDVNRYDTKNYLGSVSNLKAMLNNDLVLDVHTFFELYKINWDIRQAVRKIANSVARNGLYLRDNNNQVIDDEAFEDEVAELFKDKTFLKFKIEVFRNYLISWELYIIPSFNLYWEVKGFEVLDTQAVSKEIDGQWNIIGYKVRGKTGQIYKYWLEDLAYFKLEDSISDSNNGMGLLWSVVYDCLCELEAERTNLYFYKNSAIPSALLLLDDGLSKEEMQIAKDMFQEQFRGSENQHKTFVGGGIKDIKVLAMNNRDMEFINQRKLSTEKVSATFGVPKSILGYTDNVNYANAREQRKEFLEGTIRPYENDFENILNTLLFMFRPDIAKSYYVKCDGEQLEETEELYNSQRQDVQTWIRTINEIRIDRGLEPLDDENADKLLVSKGMSLLEDITLDAVLPINEV